MRTLLGVVGWLVAGGLVGMTAVRWEIADRAAHPGSYDGPLEAGEAGFLLVMVGCVWPVVVAAVAAYHAVQVLGRWAMRPPAGDGRGRGITDPRCQP